MFASNSRRYSITAYLCLNQVGPHAPGDVVTVDHVPNADAWTNQTTITNRLLTLGAIRVATAGGIAQGPVTRLTVSFPLERFDDAVNPLKQMQGQIPGDFTDDRR